MLICVFNMQTKQNTQLIAYVLHDYHLKFTDLCKGKFVKAMKKIHVLMA